MSSYCSECVVHWWPYQARAGRCPQCGGGTRRSFERPGEEATERHRTTMREAKRRQAHAAFEAYYAQREARGDAA